jgi:hypothetical protein
MICSKIRIQGDPEKPAFYRAVYCQIQDSILNGSINYVLHLSGGFFQNKHLVRCEKCHTGWRCQTRYYGANPQIRVDYGRLRRLRRSDPDGEQDSSKANALLHSSSKS